jgi:hypothetical protein
LKNRRHLSNAEWLLLYYGVVFLAVGIIVEWLRG